MYTTCRVGVLSSEISKHSKISPPPSLRSHLTSSPMGVFSGDYGRYKRQHISVMFVGIGSAISIAIFESVRGSARS